MKKRILGEECYRVMRACFEIYREKGCGFLEAVFHECLEIEFGLRKNPFRSKVELPLKYKGLGLEQRYIADFLCFEKIIVEIKAAECLASEHTAQVINYLNSTGCRLGLLVDFGHSPGLEWKRLAH